VPGIGFQATQRLRWRYLFATDGWAHHSSATAVLVSRQDQSSWNHSFSWEARPRFPCAGIVSI